MHMEAICVLVGARRCRRSGYRKRHAPPVPHVKHFGEQLYIVYIEVNPRIYRCGPGSMDG